MNCPARERPFQWGPTDPTSCICNLCLQIRKLEAEVKNKLYPFALFEPYTVGDRVAFDSIAFTCIKDNIGAPENMPGQGVDWKTYWVARLA